MYTEKRASLLETQYSNEYCRMSYIFSLLKKVCTKYDKVRSCKRTQYWRPRSSNIVGSVCCTPCWMLLHVVGSCCTKFETVPWLQKRSTTMLNPFVQLFPYNVGGHARALHSWFTNSYGLYLLMIHCRSQHWIWNCCILLQTVTNTDTTTPLCM